MTSLFSLDIRLISDAGNIFVIFNTPKAVTFSLVYQLVPKTNFQFASSLSQVFQKVNVIFTHRLGAKSVHFGADLVLGWNQRAISIQLGPPLFPVQIGADSVQTRCLDGTRELFPSNQVLHYFRWGPRSQEPHAPLYRTF